MNDSFVKISAGSKEIAAILSSYAFTVGGFLATIVTFLYTLGDRPYFKLYKGRGSFGDLGFVHAIEFLLLGALFVVSVGVVVFPDLMRLALCLAIVSLMNLTLLIFISFNLSKRSNEGR